MSVNRNRTTNRKRPRTTWNGWRIVACGVLLLIFGSSLLTYSSGPAWFALLLLLIGLALAVYGRRH
jgi:fatty acid desaturase